MKRKCRRSYGICVHLLFAYGTMKAPVPLLPFPLRRKLFTVALPSSVTPKSPAGSAFTANPGEYLELGNATSANARVVATALLPKGAPLSIDQAGFSNDAYSGPTDGYRLLDSVARAPRPTTVYHSAIAVERPAGAFELVHVVLDFEPGVWTPRHMHGGPELVMLTIGELTLQRQGEVMVFAAGDSWVNTAGLVHAAGNDGRSFAQAVATFLLPAGRPLTTVV